MIQRSNGGTYFNLLIVYFVIDNKHRCAFSQYILKKLFNLFALQILLPTSSIFLSCLRITFPPFSLNLQIYIYKSLKFPSTCNSNVQLNSTYNSCVSLFSTCKNCVQLLSKCNSYDCTVFEYL